MRNLLKLFISWFTKKRNKDIILKQTSPVSTEDQKDIRYPRDKGIHGPGIDTSEKAPKHSSKVQRRRKKNRMIKTSRTINRHLFKYKKSKIT